MNNTIKIIISAITAYIASCGGYVFITHIIDKEKIGLMIILSVSVYIIISFITVPIINKILKIKNKYFALTIGYIFGIIIGYVLSRLLITNNNINNKIVYIILPMIPILLEIIANEYYKMRKEINE